MYAQVFHIGSYLHVSLPELCILFKSLFEANIILFELVILRIFGEK
jgi:hypothetical protein